MISALLLSLFAAGPDAFGSPFLDAADAAYLSRRLIKPESPSQVVTDEELDLRICALLFEDCRSAANEFDTKRAMDAHRAELDARRASVAKLKTVTMGATVCFKDFDFKAHGYPVERIAFNESLTVAYDHPFFPAASNVKSFALFRMPDSTAEAIRTTYWPCVQGRAEVELPNKPLRWPLNKVTRSGTPGGLTLITAAEPPDVPVVIKKLRLVNNDGETIVVFFK